MSRDYCYDCYRPKTTCLCGKITPVDNKPLIIILQHKDEVRHPKGSAIIAGLYLKQCLRYVGEDFSSHHGLNEILEQNTDNVFVVFPAKNAISFSQFQCRDEIEDKSLDRYVFVFIDASWRKARKIWHLSSNLHPLTTIELDQVESSNYRIRKSPQPGLLSTLESIVSVLSSLESAPDKYQPLLNLFDEMINHQIECMGEQVYQENYKA